MLRVIFRIIPWWGWLILAASLAQPGLRAVERYSAAQSELGLALRSAEPPRFLLENFRPPADPGPMDEARILANWAPALAVPEDRESPASWLRIYHYEVVFGADGRWMGLAAPFWRADEMRAALAGMAAPNGPVIVAGFVEDARAVERFRRALAARGLEAPEGLTLIDPYFIPRGAALDRRLAETGYLALAWGGGAVLALLLGIAKFRIWRGRLRARGSNAAPPPLPANAPRPSAAALAAAGGSKQWAAQMREMARAQAAAAQGQSGTARAKAAARSSAPRSGPAQKARLAQPSVQPDYAATPIRSAKAGRNSDPVIRSTRSGREFEKSPIISSGRGLFS